MSWESANVPTFQLTWLANELETAASLNQHVIVFVHYRVDGGPGGPVRALLLFYAVTPFMFCLASTLSWVGVQKTLLCEQCCECTT